MADVLEEVHVRDLALIREAWLELGPGLNVLTGETGAGKTVLVEALQLLVGERADPSMVRSGAGEALVEGRFLVDGREVLARRRVASEGRSRCYLDDGLATVTSLAERLGPLVDLHGQHDHQSLLRPGTHAAVLCRFAGPAAVTSKETYRAARIAHGEAAHELSVLEESLADAERRRDYLAFTVSEIDEAAIEEGEDERLAAILPRLRHGEKLAQAASAAVRALRGEGLASDAVGEATKALSHVSGVDPALDAMAEEVAAAQAALDDVSARLRSYGESVDYDPEALDRTESRLALLAVLKKKYGPTLADVADTAAKAREELGLVDAGEERSEAARARVERAREDLATAATGYRERLEEAVPSFLESLSAAAEDLEMGAARFEVAIEEREFGAWTDEGPMRVEILFSSSAGDPPKPLAKVASGGEVSRVMLALKSVLGSADDTDVLVFDEIDAGIGGQTALAVGRRLAALAVEHQVVVVTHLAQVAAFADRHLVVSKVSEGDRSVTTVALVDGDERERELARMLGGTDSETGRAHARELLASVRQTA